MSTPTPRTKTFVENYSPLTIESCLAWAEQLETELSESQAQLDSANRKYEEEKQIVSRVWDLLGNPTYKELEGRSIYDLIAELQDQLASAREDALDLDFLERSIKNSFHDPEFQFIELKEGPLYDHIRLVMYNGRTTVAYEGGGSIRVAIRKARGVTCKTCEGLGVVGYTIGQTPESFEQGEYPCPDCSPPAVAETGEKDAWQDIATAPKDGTNILLYLPYRIIEGGAMKAGSWLGHAWTYEPPDESWYNPTHWTALPPPPQGKERE